MIYIPNSSTKNVYTYYYQDILNQFKQDTYEKLSINKNKILEEFKILKKNVREIVDNKDKKDSTDIKELLVAFSSSLKEPDEKL